jgi:cytochrome b561
MTAELNPIRKALHWIVAILEIAMIPAGLIFTDFDNKPLIESLFGEGAFDRFFNLHKAMGFTVLGLVILRLLAALIWPAPAYKPPLFFPVRIAAHATHATLYALLIVVPLLGWLGVSAFPAPLPFFGLFDMPPIAPADKELSHFALYVHGLLAMTLAAIAVIHIAAGIWHRSVKRDTVFNRVSFAPGRKARRPEVDAD